jgi:cell division protein FtsB
LSAVLETEQTRLQESFQKHAERVGIATQAIDAFAATTEKARTENSEDLRARSDDIRRLAETLNRTAATIAGRALINVFLAGIVCGGVCGAALVIVLRK